MNRCPGIGACGIPLVNKLSDLPDPPVVFEEYMDFARFSGAAQRSLFAEFLERKYADKQLDLLVVESGAASVYFSIRPELTRGSAAHVHQSDRKRR